MLALNFHLYDRLIDSITSFFKNPKENSIFLLTFGLGALISIIFFSNIILFLLINYHFITMMFFLGLITGGTYNFSKSISLNTKIIIITILIFSIIYLIPNYRLNNNSLDNILFFIGGIIEMFSSIVPGISGTSLLMIIGIYDQVLLMISNIYNYSYVINHLNIYISYGIGMFISFIINIYLISYLLKKHNNIFSNIILGLSIGSIFFLIKETFIIKINILNIIVGIIFFILGIILSYFLEKK